MSYSKTKVCKTCGKRLTTNNQTGFCNKHRDRTGANNPFFGKTHTKEVRKQISEKGSAALVEKWKDPDYRERVIKGTSKPRNSKFKKEQSKRITQWYKDNPEQRKLRSKSMKASWETGKMVSGKKPAINRSKDEILFFEDIQRIYGIIENKTISIKKKWYFPDILLQNEKIIIEFYGDYWHANPSKYKQDDIVHHNLTAQEIWEADRIRQETLEEEGYTFYIVWESEYKNNKEEVLARFDSILNWEVC